MERRTIAMEPNQVDGGISADGKHAGGGGKHGGGRHEGEHAGDTLEGEGKHIDVSGFQHL